MSLQSTVSPQDDGTYAGPRAGIGDVFDLTLLLASAGLLLWVMWTCSQARPHMWDAVALLGANGALAGIGFIITLRQKFPIMLTCFYFDFLFLAVAPIQQIGVGFDPIFSYEYEFYAAIAGCLMFTVFGLVGLYACARPVYRLVPARSLLAHTSYEPHYYPVVLWTPIALITSGVLIFLGPHLLTTRDALILYILDSVDKSGSLVLTSFLAPFVFIGSVIGLRGALFKRDHFWIIAFIVILALASLISINPSVLPRFRVSALLVFALLVITGWNNTRAVALFLVAGAVVSPLLNAFRGATNFSSEIRPFERFFAHMDFDCFSLVVHVIRYVGDNGYSYGTNILAALLFVVPRAIWPEKSEHVGYYIFPQLRYYRNVWTDNVSSPPMAEGYFAYGALGAVLFCACVWAGFVLLERAARAADRDSPLQLMACLTPIYAMMILRGPFLVGYSELWGNYAALVTALALLHVKIRLRPTPHRSIQPPGAQQSSF
jgi:hypothetical protein